MDLVHPTVPTWVSDFGPTVQERDKLLPLAMKTPGIMGLCQGLSSSSIQDGSFKADLEDVLATLQPGQGFRLAISAQPAATGGRYPVITVTIPVLHKPPAPHNIIQSWNPAVPDLMLADHQTVWDWITQSPWESQFAGFSLGGFGSVIADTELSPFPGSGHNSALYLTDGLTAGTIEDAVQSTLAQIAYGVAEMAPGRQSALCIADAKHASFTHRNDNYAFANGLFSGASAAIGAAGTLASVWESMETTIPEWHLSLGAPIYLQDKEGYLWMGEVPQGANVAMIQRHLTDWKADFVPIAPPQNQVTAPAPALAA